MTGPDSDTESTSSDSSEELTPPSVRSIPQTRIASPTPLIGPLSRLTINETMSTRGESSNRGGSAPDAPPNVERSGSKLVAEPDHYHGDRRKFSSFVSQLQLNFLNRRSELNTDEKRVIFAASYLRGSPQEWFRPYLTDHMNNMGNLAGRRAETASMFLWTGFYNSLQRMYGDSDERRTAERKMEGLRQTSSVAAYATLFQQYRPQLGWNDEALLSQFRLGLKSEIKDMLYLMPNVPNDMTRYIDLCIKLDQRVIERRWEKGGKAHHPGANTQRKRYNPRGQDPDEMDWEFSATRGRPRGAPQSNRGPLTPAQRKERMDKNLCLYCGKPGHRAKECRAKGNKSMAATQHTFAATSNEMHLGNVVRFAEQANIGRPRRTVTQAQRIANANRESHPTVGHPGRRKFKVLNQEGASVHISTRYWVEMWCTDWACDGDAQHSHKRFSPTRARSRQVEIIKVTGDDDLVQLYELIMAWKRRTGSAEANDQLGMLRSAMSPEAEEGLTMTDDDTESSSESGN